MTILDELQKVDESQFTPDSKERLKSQTLSRLDVIIDKSKDQMQLISDKTK